MSPVEDLDKALAQMEPQIEGRYVFITTDSVPPGLEPFAVIRESEGLTLIVRAEDAASFGLSTDRLFARITSGTHTSLFSVGITSTITSTIASRGIPCNVIAGYYRDHFFVPAEKGEETVAILQSLAKQAAGWMPQS